MRKDLPSLGLEEEEASVEVDNVCSWIPSFQYDRGKEKDMKNIVKKGSIGHVKDGMVKKESHLVREYMSMGQRFKSKVLKDRSNHSSQLRKDDVDLQNRKMKVLKEKMKHGVSDNKIQDSTTKYQKIKIVSGEVTENADQGKKQRQCKIATGRCTTSTRNKCCGRREETTVVKELMVRQAPIENDDDSEKKDFMKEDIQRYGFNSFDKADQCPDKDNLSCDDNDCKEFPIGENLHQENRAIEQSGDVGIMVGHFDIFESLEYRMGNTLPSEDKCIPTDKHVANFFNCTLRGLLKDCPCVQGHWYLDTDSTRKLSMKEIIKTSEHYGKRPTVKNSVELMTNIRNSANHLYWKEGRAAGIGCLKSYMEKITRIEIQTEELSQQMETLKQHFNDVLLKDHQVWFEGNKSPRQPTAYQSLYETSCNRIAKIQRFKRGWPNLCSRNRQKMVSGIKKYTQTLNEQFLDVWLFEVFCGRNLLQQKARVRRASEKNHSSSQNKGGNNGQGNKQQANSNKKNGETSEKESRNQDDEKDRDEKEDMSSNNNKRKDYGFPANENGACGIGARYKYRRKHGNLPNGEMQLFDVLGWLENAKEDIPPDILLQLNTVILEVNNCLIVCLKKQDTNTQVEDCSLCLCISGLIQHFGLCQEMYTSSCRMCKQIFQLILSHVKICLQNTSGTECPILVCRKICYLVSSNTGLLDSQANKIWRKLKKFMGGFIDETQGLGVEGEELFSLTSLTSISSGMTASFHNSLSNPSPLRSSRRGSLFMSALPIISEDTQERSLNLPVELKQSKEALRVSKSEPICRKRPDGKIEYFNQPGHKFSKKQSSVFNKKFDAADGKPFPERPKKLSVTSGLESFADEKRRPPTPSVSGPPVGFLQNKSSLKSPTNGLKHITSEERGKRLNRVSFSKETKVFDNAPSLRLTSLESRYISDIQDDALGEDAVQIQQSDVVGGELPPQQGPSLDTSESRSFEMGDSKTYGNQMISLPNVYRSPLKDDVQILSLKERPTGTPGIGEVVYGTRNLLLVVIRYWNEIKMEYKNNGRLLRKNNNREEGIIFPEFKKQLMVMKNRYQKNFQWIRLTHLGRGMTGNCHLASDYNSEYQFCIKKIHISKYQEKELEIWSDLQHDNIVKLHGALRRGEKIYILSEFIAGGSLLEVIKQQKQMMRRLSQWSALSYLKQILTVLIYLQKKSVIHEDLKADNILLHENSQAIAVGDFGTAVKITGETTRSSTSVAGTPTQFSPEKAYGTGHGFKSDLWSAICVLFHMLSGDPPWVKRYPNAKMLNFLIVENEPPIVDVPGNVSQDVLDLIKDGFQKDPRYRPTAEELLAHRAFKLLDDNPDTFTSILLTSAGQLPTTRLPISDDRNDGEECLSIINHIEEILSIPAPCDHRTDSNNMNFFSGKLSVWDGNTVKLGNVEKMESMEEKQDAINRTNISINIDSLLPSAEDNNIYLTSYLEDNPGELERRVESTLPPYTGNHDSKQESPHDNIDAFSGEYQDREIPVFELLLHPDIEQFHRDVMIQQMSSSSGGDEDHQRSTSRSSSQIYSSSDIDREYRIMQDSIINYMTRVSEDVEGAHYPSGYTTPALPEVKIEQIPHHEEDQKPQMEEPVSSINLPILTPFTASSGENTLTASGGNVPNLNLLISRSMSGEKNNVVTGTGLVNDPSEFEVNKKEKDQDKSRDFWKTEKNAEIGNHGPQTLPNNTELITSPYCGPATLPCYPNRRTMFEEDIPSIELFPSDEPDIADLICGHQMPLDHMEGRDTASSRKFRETSSDNDVFRQENTTQYHDIQSSDVSPILRKKPQNPEKKLTLIVTPHKIPSRKSEPCFPTSSPVGTRPFTTPQNNINRIRYDIFGETFSQKISSTEALDNLIQQNLSSSSTSGPYSKLSNRSQSQLDESDEALRDLITEQLSNTSNGSFIEEAEEDQSMHYNPDDHGFDESLHYIMKTYITETDEGSINGLKVTLIQTDGQKLSYRLTVENSKMTWQKIVEMDFSDKIHGCKKFTLTTPNGVTLELQDSPSDSQYDDKSLTLNVKDVSDDYEAQTWYCENGICKSGAGIPI